MNFDFKKRFAELARGRTVAEIVRDAEVRQIPLKEKTLYQALARNGVSLELAGLLATYFRITIDQFVGRAPPPPPVGDDYAQTEDERQLLKFFRGIDADRQEDLVQLANRWYSMAHPEDRSAAPFRLTSQRRDGKLRVGPGLAPPAPAKKKVGSL